MEFPRVNPLPIMICNLHSIIYADDSTLTTTLQSTGDLISEEAINKELHNVHDWLKLNKLSLNASKTKGMIFHTSQRNISYPKLYMQNTQIEFVKHFTFSVLFWMKISAGESI